MLVNFLGSVLGVAILKWLGDDFLSIASDPAGMMSYMTGNFGKLIVYFIYIFPFARRGDCRYYSLYRQSEENPLPAWNEHASKRKNAFPQPC